MMVFDEQRNERRLNWAAYANIGLGLLMLLWAVPGAKAIPSFWRDIDQELNGQSDPGAAILAMLIKVLIAVSILLFWPAAAVPLTNGFLILKRKRYRLCRILSGISLLGTPFHLIIGIFSLSLLNKDWAKKLFANDGQV